MDSVGLSQVKFAERCGIRPSNFNRALKSEKGLSPQYLLRIAHAFNVNFEWLRNGIGEMFAEERQSARRSSPPSVRCSTQMQALCRKILSAAITIKARRR